MKEQFRQVNGEYHRFSINVPKDMWLDLRLMCMRKNISVAAFFIESTRNWLNTYEKVVDKNK